MKPLAVIALMLVSVVCAAGEGQGIIVRPERTVASWDGWGVSLCWWANRFGARADLADLLFTSRTVGVTTDTGTYSLPGLGMNIARYNIGGTGAGPASGTEPKYPPGFPSFRRIEGFWRDGVSDDPATDSWDWDADANQRNMLGMARDRGATRFEAFSNSPMWWMNRNLSTAGSDDGGGNLLPEQRRNFARYLASVVKRARDGWGIPFTAVEPFNEPSAWWWKYPGTQEGCRFDVAAQAEVIGHLRAELDAMGLEMVGISASDENSFDEALKTWNTFDAATKARVDRVNVHGYSGHAAYRGPNRGPLAAALAADARPLWNSEHGEADGSGATMAKSIALDINVAKVSGWVYWQPFDSGGWGLLQSNPGDNWIGPPNPKYFVLAHYARHVRPGMSILATDDPDTVAAYDDVARRLVLVAFAGDAERAVTYDLSRFGRVPAAAARWATGTRSDVRYARRPAAPLAGPSLRVVLEPHTVQTFQMEGVRFAGTGTPEGNP